MLHFNKDLQALHPSYYKRTIYKLSYSFEYASRMRTDFKIKWTVSQTLKWTHYKAHLHWQKPGFFVVPFTLPEKPITFMGFWHEKRMREKTWISYLCFGKWCACATSLYLWPYTCSAHYVAGRGRVIRWRSRTTWPKTRIIPARLERAFTLAKKNCDISAEFQKITLRRWVFRFGFFGVFRGSCLATFNEKPECEKDSGFFMPV